MKFLFRFFVCYIANAGGIEIGKIYIKEKGEKCCDRVCGRESFLLIEIYNVRSRFCAWSRINFASLDVFENFRKFFHGKWKNIVKDPRGGNWILFKKILLIKFLFKIFLKCFKNINFHFPPFSPNNRNLSFMHLCISAHNWISIGRWSARIHWHSLSMTLLDPYLNGLVVKTSPNNAAENAFWPLIKFRRSLLRFQRRHCNTTRRKSVNANFYGRDFFKI